MMQNKNKPNAQQKRWMQTISDWASDGGIGVLYGPDWEGSDFQLHHVVGRSYIQNKVHIGHWFILPVPIELHDVHSNHPLNVTHYRKRFTESFGLQSELFCTMYEELINQGQYQDIPFDTDVLSAIDSTGF